MGFAAYFQNNNNFLNRGLRYRKFVVGTALTPCTDGTGKNMVQYQNKKIINFNILFRPISVAM